MEGIVVEIIEKYLEAELAKQQRKYLRLKYDEDAKYYFQNGYSEDAALHADIIISFWTISFIKETRSMKWGSMISSSIG